MQVTDITTVCPSPLVMTQQLTHIELQRLSFIGPSSFICLISFAGDRHHGSLPFPISHGTATDAHRAAAPVLHWSGGVRAGLRQGPISARHHL